MEATCPKWTEGSYPPRMEELQTKALRPLRGDETLTTMNRHELKDIVARRIVDEHRKHGKSLADGNEWAAIAAAKIIGTLNDIGALAAAKEEERSPTWLGHCSGCTDPHSEGTHQMGTIEHPDIDNAKEEQGRAKPVAWMTEGNEPAIMLASNKAYQCRDAGETRDYLNGKYTIPIYTHPAPAKGSGLTVEGVMEALDNVGRHEGWGLVTVAKGALRKALEAHAENSSDNLRKG